MTQVMERPRRKRLSWESRCEIVALIDAGMSPPPWPRPGAVRAVRPGTNCSPASGQAAGQRFGIDHRRRGASPDGLCPEAEQAILVARRRSAYGPVRLAGLVPHPPSTIGKCCAGMVAPGFRAPREPPAARAATSASGRASSCTWTPEARPLLGAGQARAR